MKSKQQRKTWRLVSAQVSRSNLSQQIESTKGKINFCKKRGKGKYFKKLIPSANIALGNKATRLVNLGVHLQETRWECQFRAAQIEKVSTTSYLYLSTVEIAFQNPQIYGLERNSTSKMQVTGAIP